MQKISSQQAAKLRGIQVNSKVMKQCVELIKAVKDVWKDPSILSVIGDLSLQPNFKKSMSVLDNIENNLELCQYSRGRDMINEIKDASYQMLEIAPPEFIKVVMASNRQVCNLIDNSKLQDRSIFSTISQKEKHTDFNAPQSAAMRKQLREQKQEINKLNR